MLFSLLTQSPLIFVLVAVALVVSLSIHEFAHAYVSHKLGDDTAMLLGRVTLNPLAHLDPIGTLLLLFAGFGWGKPVPFNPYNFAHPKRDSALVALAGPASNFILATVLALTFPFLGDVPLVGTFLYFAIFYNLVLGVFNLIPINPLDGFKIVNGLLPQHLSIQWLQMAPYGIYILLILVLTDSLGRILTPVLSLFMRVLGLQI